MSNPSLKITIRDNVRRLLDLAEGESGVSVVMRLGFSNGTASRILDDETQIGVDQLEKLSAALKVLPWQLCIPDLEPDRLPSLEPRQFRWPFRSIDPEVITTLVGTSAQQVENGLLATLATAGVAPRMGGRGGPSLTNQPKGRSPFKRQPSIAETKAQEEQAPADEAPSRT